MFKYFSEINIRDEDLTDDLIQEHIEEAFTSGLPAAIEIHMSSKCWAVESYFRELDNINGCGAYVPYMNYSVDESGGIGYFNRAKVVLDETIHPSRLVIMREDK